MIGVGEMGGELQRIEGDFSVCRLADGKSIPWDAAFVFVGKTDEEWSLVCPTAAAPGDCLAREEGWKMFRVAGVLDFSLVGVLSTITTALAESGIGLFAISTYNTDYLLVKEPDYDRALDALRGAGYVTAP